MNGNMIYFSDFFDVATEILDDYGAFNISMLNDLPLFIDPFLIFCNDKPEYQAMHERIIRYLRFLRDEASRQHDISAGALRSLYCFPEVKQTYLGFCQNGNSGSGLGIDFARALHSSLKDIFSDFGEETITKSPHLEKLCLIKRNVGRDNISDFVTNLIKPFLLEYTQSFARAYLPAEKCRVFSVRGVVFDESKKVWLPANFYLPYYDNDYVILTPTDLLVRDDTWINRPELIKNFERFAPSIPDDALRYQVNQYFAELLSEKPTKEERERAAEMTVSRYPALIDYYIRRKEDNEDGAYERSAAEVGNVQQIFITQLQQLVEQLKNDSAFYSLPSNTFDEALQRVNYLKHVIENCDGYRWFYDGDKPIRRESDLHLMYKLVCYNTVSSTDAEVNNGMGPVDFKHSYGSHDSTLVEFKLVRTLKKNLEKQVEVYLDAKDRRAYEYWSDGNIHAANQFMGSSFFEGTSADHIGPISLGFVHDPRYLQPMTSSDNSTKRDRLQLIGFKLAGINASVASDIMESACITLKTNCPEVPVFCGDITEESTKQRIIAAGKAASADIICGGPPCQGFSMAGWRMEDDPRNQLFRHFIDIVSAVNPKVIVFENVEGILSFQGGETYRNIIELFSELGYYTEGRKLLANHYGAPQRRKRVIILCTRKDIGVLPKDIYPEPITPNDDRQITAYETMYDLENVDCSEDAKYASSYSSYILKFLKGEIEAEEYVKYVTDKRGVLSKTSQEAETDEDDEENDDLSTSAKTKGKDSQQESVQISLFDTV